MAMEPDNIDDHVGQIFVKIIPLKKGSSEPAGEPAGEPELLKCPQEVEADTVLSFLIQKLGKMIDTAWTSTASHPRIETGWIFPNMSSTSPNERELLCVPLIRISDGSIQPLFEWLADQRQAFDRLAKDGQFETFNVIEKPQRDYQAKEIDEEESYLHWSLTNLSEYWDQEENAIAKFAGALREADENMVKGQVDWLSTYVGRMARTTPTEPLMVAGWVMADDLYKAACSTQLWDNALAQYLTATAREMTNVLTERGLTLSYVVDNTFTTESMQRPLTLFGPWFQSSGFVYICPQAIAVDFAKSTGETTEGLIAKSEKMDEARDIANQLVNRCLQERLHYLYIDTDFQPDALNVLVKEPCTMQGVIAVFRNEPPVAGTKVQVHLPDTGSIA